MASRVSRITNAQRAAVCALVLVGHPFGEACQVVGAARYHMRQLVGRDWHNSGNRRRLKWKGELLHDMEAAYRDHSLHVDTVAAMFGVTRRQVAALAQREGWPRRQGKGSNPLPVPLLKMEPEKRRRYTKLQRIIGRAAAQQAIFGSAP